ncbi:MAG: serine dehydratase beta chain [Christensenellales bacterium]
MNLFDILGPVMVGPSSSHTAGAVRIGLAAPPFGRGDAQSAEITLFVRSATGRGHGLDRALIAGLLGYKPDDERIADSYAWAKGYGMDVHFEFSKRAAEHRTRRRSK